MDRLDRKILRLLQEDATLAVAEIAKIEIRDVSSSFAMEQIKYTTELPLDYVSLAKENG
jgi:DNA-binding Lrp family transcriptional regulator